MPARPRKAECAAIFTACWGGIARRTRASGWYEGGGWRAFGVWIGRPDGSGGLAGAFAGRAFGDGRALSGAAGRRADLGVARGRDRRVRGADWRRGEVAGLPEADELFQAAEDAREDGRDHGVQGSGQPSAIIV